MRTVPPDRMPGERPLDGLVEYETALSDLIAHTTQTLRLFDHSIGANFNTPERAALLHKLLLERRANRIYIVLHETGNLVRDCPRLVTLGKHFSHALFIRQTLPPARGVYDPFAIGDDTRLVHRFHYNGMKGVASQGDMANTMLLVKRFEELWEASTPALTATTLGL